MTSVYMNRALDLAGKGTGLTDPNPLVGCVVVHRGLVVGEGFHMGPGTHHAEEMALRQAGSLARGADLYVNLEPCAHWGRRPPCAELIVKSGVRRVFASLADPDTRVSGKGFSILRTGGIVVEIGMEREKAIELNRPYLTRTLLSRPLIHLKTAQSLDGRISDPRSGSRWLTGDDARERGHRLRHRLGAIVVGRGTHDTDDPRLTSRIPGGIDPIRIVLAPRGITRTDSHFVRSAADGKSWLFAESAPRGEAYWDHLRECGVVIEELGPGPWPMSLVVSRMAERGVNSCLVEGGGDVTSRFLGEDLWDVAEWHIAPRVVASASASALSIQDSCVSLGKPEVRSWGADVGLIYRRERLCLPD